MRVLVTGANGFLGRQILAELKSQGYTSLAFVRGAQIAKQLQDNGFECVVGTLDSPSDLYNALENVPAIIHAAGGGKASEPQSFLKNNVITTQQLLESAKQSGVKRFVLISSLAAAGLSSDGQPKGNETSPQPISPYGESKRRRSLWHNKKSNISKLVLSGPLLFTGLAIGVYSHYLKPPTVAWCPFPLAPTTL